LQVLRWLLKQRLDRLHRRRGDVKTMTIQET
jgi:hypothetical protein